MGSASGKASVMGLDMEVEVPRGAAENAMKSAEQLFEQRPVEEIRGVERRAKEQVDRKREELREVVGASYREFIDSADGIEAMGISAASAARDLDHIRMKILELGEGLEAKLAKGENGVATEDEGNGALPLGTRLFALGSRAKVLLDTSESIWAVLEAEKTRNQRLFTEPGSSVSGAEADAASESDRRSGVLSHGARLAARAFVLWKTQGGEISKKFPVLSKQKVQLVDLCKKLRRACLRRLESKHADRDLSVDALAALVLLDVIKASQSANGEQGIKSGLSLCSLWLKQRLAAITTSVTSWENLSCVAEIVTGALREVERLFSPQGGGRGKPNPSPLCLVDVENDIWYEALPRHQEELTIWRGYVRNFAQTAAPISPKAVSELCAKWVSQAQAEAERLGREQCARLGGLPDLMEAERGVRKSISEPEGGAEAEKDFDQRCLSILRRKVGLWREFYERAFSDRAMEIIRNRFEEVLPAVKGELSIASDPSADAQVEYRNKLCRALGMIRHRVGTTFLEAVEFFLIPEDPTVTEQRITSLQGFLQECCRDLLREVGEHLERTMGELSSAGGGGDAGLCEYGVFLSNLCDCLQTENSEIFRFVFGKPAGWVGARGAARRDISAVGAYSLDLDALHQRRSGVLDQVPEPSLSSARRALSSLECPLRLDADAKLRKISEGAFAAFVDRVCGDAEAALSRGLDSDQNLRSPKASSNWDEVVVQHTDEEGNPVDTKFSLPNVPSAHVVDALFASLREYHRSRYVKTNLGNLRSLERELGRTFVRSISKFLDRSSGAVTERGALQLLFDVRFAQDVLAGGEAGPVGSLGSLGLGSAKGSALEARLSQLLDPIDWATYEPYLWKNEVSFYHRCGLLFQDFVSVRRAHENKDAKAKQSSAKSNIMEMAANVPRFNYLPISTPSAFRGADDAASGEGEAGGKQGRQSEERSNIFGSILGEKAAEATAMAQDLFSGASFFNALSK